MAIDTKTTAGGVVVLLLSGTGGYLATNAINGETTTPTTSLEGGQSRSGDSEGNKPTPATNEGQERDSSVTPEVEESSVSRERTERENTPSSEDGASVSATDQEEVKTPAEGADTAPKEQVDLSKIMKEKITADKFETIDESDNKCAEALKKEFNSTNYKAAVKACVKTLTLKERAVKLGIELIDRTNQEGSDALKNRFNSLGKESAYGFATASVETIIWDQTTGNENINIKNLKEFCTKVEAITLEKIHSKTSNQSLEKEWTNYLKVCAKSDSESKSFWTLSEVEK